MPVWITVSDAGSEQALFRELARRVQGWLTRRGLDTGHAQAEYEALRAAPSWDEMQIQLKVYLEELRRTGYQVVAVLDEFDAARKVFTHSAPFGLLRAIAYEPEIRVALIITSRRTLNDIVVRSTAELSTFPGIFGAPETLGCFGDDELTELIERSPYTGEGLRKTLFALLERETGGQPFLSSALLSALHERWARHGPPASSDSIEERFTGAVAECGQLIAERHRTMLELLREERRAHDALRGAVRAAGDSRPTRREAAGARRHHQGKRRRLDRLFRELPAVSPPAGRHLTTESHMLWPKTEVGLRAALTAGLLYSYGDRWQSALADSHPRLVRECERRRSHVPETDDEDLLDYTYPDDLLTILKTYWHQVEPFFGHSRQEWETRLEFLKRMRTPLSHSRRSKMSPQDLEKFRVTCLEILKWLEAARAARAN